ncbi:hypothetical protein GF420_00625 [candidate division GN15 bacterium]|nr:hypothetical protein [candidate division GN15 bacterium]
MKNEMDLMGMDERQRWCWLMADRATLFVVGIVWLALILEQMLDDRTPWFMIVMVPVFALIRAAFYRAYCRPRRGEESVE